MIDRIERRLARNWPLVLLLVAGTLGATWVGQITGSAITSDAVATARMAVNLVHHGVVSTDGTDAPQPTMYREPFPALSVAAAVVVTDALLGPARVDAYLTGDRARYLKYHHVVWKAVAVAATYFLIYALCSSHAAALFGALLLGTRPDLDALLTELEAGALFVLGLAVLTIGLRRGSRSAFVAAGVCFGLLALTKAAYLYVFVGFLVALPVVLWWMRGAAAQRAEARRIATSVTLLAVAFAAVVLPWMARNYAHFGELKISGRAGVVLYTRAVKNDMTWDEYKGAFYAWSPRRIRDAVGYLMGYTEADLRLGGRVQRFNRDIRSEFAALDRAAEDAGRPEEALTYYRQARAERVRLTELYSRELPRIAAEQAADRELSSRALDHIRAEPLKHLATTVPFLWRGAGLLFPVLVVALVFGVCTRRRELTLVALMAVGYVMLHALLTHYEPRFSTPLKPVAIAIALVPLVALAERVRVLLLGRQPVRASA